MAEMPKCSSCSGSGEVPTDYGCVDCPDCGGAGFLPSRSVLIEWRARDMERGLAQGGDPAASDVRWALAEMQQARAALTEIIALAHDINDDSAIAQRIRFVANRTLGLYEIGARDKDVSGT